VHYSGKFEYDTVFDTSIVRQPIKFTIGKGQVIPGFDEAVEGMNPGESKTVLVPVEKAYGPHRKEEVMVVNRNRLPAYLESKVDQRLQLCQANDRTVAVTVTGVSESKVTLDTNHP
jgi:peptidylprolyl isomerase